MSEPTNTSEPERRHTRRGLQPLKNDALALLKHHFKSRGLAHVDLIAQWVAIAGQDLAERCAPARLSAPSENGATLTLLADDRAVLQLQHQAPQLIDRINRFFGAKIVSKIKVLNGEFRKPVAERKVKRRALSAEEIGALEAAAAGVSNPDLRAALARLGRHALEESQKSTIFKR